MWHKIASFILRRRLPILGLVVALSGYMIYEATGLEMVYTFQRVVPADDEDYNKFEEFKKTFGEDGNVLLVGFNSDKIFDLEFFNDFYKTNQELTNAEGIQNILSLSKLYNLERNDESQSFKVKQLPEKEFANQLELDSFKNYIEGLKFYHGLLYNPENNFTMVLLTFKKEQLNSKARLGLVKTVENKYLELGKKYQIDFKFSGLPYIRTIYQGKVANEFKLFTLLAFLVCIIILLLFFRSFYTLLYSFVVVGLGVIFALGWTGVFDYKISILLGLIPPIIVVISITNVVYVVNKFHVEFRDHGNKIKAISRVLTRIGAASFLTNTTTAIGFGVAWFTGSEILQEFGIVSFLSIISLYILCMTVVPILLSYMPDPGYKQLKHLDNKYLGRVNNLLLEIVNKKRKLVYTIFITFTVLSITGIFFLKAKGYIIDDLPQKDKIVEDIKYFEKEINGVMPFEVVVDTKKPNGVKDLVTLQRIEKFQREVSSRFKEISKPLSITEMIKFANQAYYYGDSRRYILPSVVDIGNIAAYLPKGNNNGTNNILKSMVDSSFQKARISFQIADIGSDKIVPIKDGVIALADSIFPKEQYEVNVTGTSVIFLKGNQFLVSNLIQSLLIAYIVIAVILAILFGSFKMILISLTTNTIPLIFTAGFMGFMDINLKPSTVMVFSIAFGMAVDFSIHYVARFRMDLKKYDGNIGKAVNSALAETAPSMIYTSFVLFFGFSIFIMSTFGGTVSLGILTTLTLVVALFTNILLLPSLLLSFEKSINKKELLKKHLLEIED